MRKDSANLVISDPAVEWLRRLADLLAVVLKRWLSFTLKGARASSSASVKTSRSALRTRYLVVEPDVPNILAWLCASRMPSAWT